MKLILEAIKSLFRKVENAISQTETALGKRIDKVQSTANTARTNASKANANALTAQATADEAKANAAKAQATAKHVLSAAVSSTTATVSTAVSLEDGKIYTLIPNATATVIGNAIIKVNGVKYYVYCGVSAPNLTGYGGVYAKSNIIFRENTPIPVLYSAAKQSFYLLSKTIETYVKTEALEGNPSASQYIYAYDTSTVAKKIKYMRVRSSTAGSTKYFDISVDDSGTLTATEVTT